MKYKIAFKLDDVEVPYAIPASYAHERYARQVLRRDFDIHAKDRVDITPEDRKLFDKNYYVLISKFRKEHATFYLLEVC